MSESKELKKAVKGILSKHNVALKEAIRGNLSRFAGHFKEQGLIEQDTVDTVSDVTGIAPFNLAAKVVNACQPMLENYPQEKFPGFIARLKDYETTKRLAKEMEDEFKGAGGKMPDEGGHVTLATGGQVATSLSSTGMQVLSDKPGVHPKPVHKGLNPQQDLPQDETDFPTPKEDQEVQQLGEQGNRSAKPVYTYPMDSSPHGQAVIFNFIGETKENHYPEGSRKSVRNFKDTFESLDYEVNRYPSLSKEDMIRRMTENVTDKDDSFVCCILAHGDQGIIYAKENEEVEIKELQKAVGEKCQKLAEKPKIFLIQACRGGAAVKPMGKPQENTKLSAQLSREADFYIAYSTTEGHISTIDEKDGCLYLNKLCEVFKEKAAHLTLDEMVMEVNHKLKREVLDVEDKGEHIQMGQVVHTLCGPVRF